jgi:hypothetical protein
MKEQVKVFSLIRGNARKTRSYLVVILLLFSIASIFGAVLNVVNEGYKDLTSIFTGTAAAFFIAAVIAFIKPPMEVSVAKKLLKDGKLTWDQYYERLAIEILL